jgi:signal transduction histidine kinase/CheY-like chemotaxis protein
MDASPLENGREKLDQQTDRSGRGEYRAGMGSENSYELAADGNREREAQWAARLVCAGSFLTLIYETVFLLLDRRFLSTAQPKILIFHGINISLFGLAVIMAARVGPWMRRHWKPVAFSFGSLMIVSSACIAVQTGEEEPLTIALILFLAGTGPFLCWGEKTQAWLTVVAILAFATVSRSLPAGADWYQWLGVLVGAAIGLFSTGLERRLRRAQHRAEDELLKSRETLVAQERMRMAGQLAAGIAHDLNNTLNVMKLRLALLIDDEAVSAKERLQMEAIDRAIDDAARTVARVRELGKPLAYARTETAQLSEIIEQAIDQASTSLEEKSSLDVDRIQIEWHSTRKLLPEVRGNASEIRQMLLNLLLNASDAMQHRGRILVELDLVNDAVVVRVSDEGAGIPEQNLERIFEPFFTTKGPRGTGLGLAIARKVMGSIGGSISAANRPRGGAIFTLRFPLAELSEAVTESQVQVNPSGRGYFLLADDDAENLAALKEILSRRGHAVDTALSGAEAIEKLRSQSIYDVVLCDLGMPGVNGWEVARQSSKLRTDLDFFIVTGWGGQPQSNVPHDVKICGVLAKPIRTADIDHVFSVISDRIAAREAAIADTAQVARSCGERLAK